MSGNNPHTLKPRYSEQVCQTLFVHYIEKFTISNVIKMLSKSTKKELGFVHYIKKFTISRFFISRFECSSNSDHVIDAEAD